MHTIGRILCLVAALCTVNGHLFLGQGVAWITMIHDRAPEMGLSDAVADTFSGESPCSRCHLVAAEQEKQQEQTPIPESRPTAKFAPILQSSPHHKIVFATPQTSVAPEPAGLHTQFIDEIPSPPPWSV